MMKVFCQDGQKKECPERHVRKARKEYNCESCKAKIAKGDLYYGTMSTLGMGRGKLFNMVTGRLCIPCAESNGYVVQEPDDIQCPRCAITGLKTPEALTAHTIEVHKYLVPKQLDRIGVG